MQRVGIWAGIVLIFLWLAILTRYEYIPFAAGAGAGSGGSYDSTGDFRVEINFGLYKVDRWTGRVWLSYGGRQWQPIY